ncbi:MAG: phosphoglucosamine mutase [Candidatus Pacebacteria bacterium]|nr:phosphoglucosamine mutase [Candidatus Paceibacterota bacterium]
MEQKPKLWVSGYRAIWGKDLDEQIAYVYARAYAKFVKEQGGDKILVGRDARTSGPIILSSITKAFQAEGIQVDYAGILPTPTMLLLVKKLNYVGGIMITASHNPIEYNGIKFIVSGGRLTNAEEIISVQKFYDELTEEEKTLDGVTLPEPTKDNKEYRKIHIDEILKNIDVELIKSKNFKVALDPVNSGGSIITQEMLKELGCTVHVINGEMNGIFAHRPEPLPENLGQIAVATKESGSDIGFAQDPDADRLVVVNEKGVVVSEEATLVLAIKNILSKEAGDIVINLSTSRMGEDLAIEAGRKVYRTKIGESNVVQKLLETNSPIGGEGSSGAIYPKINTARDSLVGIALVLELVARENKKISEIVESLPKYFLKKENIHYAGDLPNVYTKLKEKFKDAEVNEMDGIKFDFKDLSWIHIRPSNTEPLVRIFGEAKTEERIEALFVEVRLTLQSK